MADHTPPSARCATCHHVRSFHPGGGKCRANRCTVNCTAFVVRPDQPLLPAPPATDTITSALTTLTAAIEHAAGTPGARRAAAALGEACAVAAIRAAMTSELADRLRTCLETPVPYQGTEVTDVQDKPHQDDQHP